MIHMCVHEYFVNRYFFLYFSAVSKQNIPKISHKIAQSVSKISYFMTLWINFGAKHLKLLFARTTLIFI